MTREDHGFPSAAEPQPMKRSRHERPKRRCRRLRGRSWATDGTPIKHGERKRLLWLWKKWRSWRRYQGVVDGDSQLHLEGLFWESVFHPCSIRGSPENLVENEGFLLTVVRISRITTEASDGDEPRGTWQLTLASTVHPRWLQPLAVH